MVLRRGVGSGGGGSVAQEKVGKLFGGVQFFRGMGSVA